MAKAMENELPDLIEAGIVITKYGHNISEKWEVGSEKSKIKILEAGHPIPDEPKLNATKEIIRLLKNADEKNTCGVPYIQVAVLRCLQPHTRVSLDEKQKITQLLLKAGADINELNIVESTSQGLKEEGLLKLHIRQK